ncbi:hypothetical protein [Fusobacterium nucleatum]|uniref:hypothetical protein n=1 Tax=Fusobacterium nucleatum TaxID=851 RepID=UPI000410BE7E|nr:hypothetical protein [Fusobacterium nucleatum]
MEAKIKNIDLFKVKDNGNIYYGFSQKWYKDLWQQEAGCGPTVASSIVNYYKQIDNFKEVGISDALKIMEELWFYLLPTDEGLNSVKLFYDGIKNFYNGKEVTIDYINVGLKNKPNLDEIKSFIVKEFSEDRPIAFLNLCNGEEKNLDKWHWVVVVEIFEENGEYFLHIIDDKEIKKINLSLWYRTITNDGGFITFK